MMLAVYLVAIMAAWVSLVSTTKATEQAVPRMEEQPELYNTDIPAELRLHRTSSHPQSWDRPPRPWDSLVRSIIHALFSDRQTSICGTPIATASGPARRTDSAYAPLTVDGPVPEMAFTADATAVSSFLTVDGPIGDTSSVEGAAASGSGLLDPKVTLDINDPILDKTQAESEAALNFDPLHTTVPLTIDGQPALDPTFSNGAALVRSGLLDSIISLLIDRLAVDKTSANEAAASGFCPLISLAIDGPVPNTISLDGVAATGSGPLNAMMPLTIDGPVQDMTPADGAVALNSDPWHSIIPLTIDGPLPVTPQPKHAASFESTQPRPEIPLTISGSVLNDHHINVRVSSQSSMPQQRVTPAISPPTPDFKKTEKKTALSRISPVLLTISAPIAEEAFTNGGASSQIPPQVSSDLRAFSNSIGESITASGKTNSSNTYGPDHATLLILSDVRPLSKTVLTGSNHSEIRQAIIFPQITIAGIIPRGRSPDRVTDSFTPWGLFCWNYGIGLFMCFLGTIFPWSCFGPSRKRCYTVVEAVVHDSPKWLLSFYQFWFRCRGISIALLDTLKDEARSKVYQASDFRDQPSGLYLDHKFDQRPTEHTLAEQKRSIEELSAKFDTLQSEKKQSEENHSRQLSEKQQELELAQKDKSRFAEANMLLRDRIDRKISSETKKQKALELAQSEKDRTTKVYEQLCESTASKVAAEAVKDRQISDLGKELESVKSALRAMSIEKENSDAANEKKITELGQQLKDTKSSLENKTVEADSSKSEEDAKVSALDSEIRGYRSQLDAETTKKEDYDAGSKREIAGLKLLLMISKAVATRKSTEKSAYESELEECRSALNTKSAELDALKAEKSSETSTQVSEAQSFRNHTAKDAQTDEKHLTSGADDCENALLSNDTTMENSADEILIADGNLDLKSGSQFHRETNTYDLGDFARPTVDIFEDSKASCSKTTVKLGRRGVVLGMAGATGTRIGAKRINPKPQDGVVRKGRGFLMKDANSAKRLFKFGPR